MNENTPTGPCREKYWHERTDAEKIVKLAEAVDYITHKLGEAGETIEKMKRHSHADGKIVVPMNGDTNERFADSYYFKNPLGQESGHGLKSW